MNNASPHARVIDFPDPLDQEAQAVRRFAATVCRVAFEVIRGMRPIQQLNPLVTPKVAARISARTALTCHAVSAPGQDGSAALVHLHSNMHIVRVVSCRVNAGVYEVSIVVAERLRHRAVALRAEAHRGRWLATCLEIG